jgi:tetratricopeptide (TPR) repeat protein
MLYIDILAGQARQYTGDFNQAADILSELKERIPKEDHVALVAVNNALANLYLRRGEWRLALGCLDQVLDLIPEATESEVRMKHFNTTSDTLALVSLLSSAYKCEVLSRQGRVLLQLGALPQVSEIFKYARKEWTATESNLSPDLANHIAVKLTSCQMEVNEAVFYFAQSNNEHAVESFKKALKILRKQRILSPKYNPDVWMGLLVWSFDVSNTLYSECINNMALCSLYSCRMKEAVNLLEDLVRADPTAFLTERVAFNLCTLYELGADSAVSARRKRILQLIAKRFFLHDIGPESFRVQ